MSNLLKSKIKIESRQQSNKKIRKQIIFSSNTLGTINKENTEKKILKDLSLKFLNHYSTTSLTNKTCANHNHKKIIIKEKPHINNSKKVINLNNHKKYLKFPLKINYKQSVSLKNLPEDENSSNVFMGSSYKRKNTNTKIELFSTNSTLSFLNQKDNNNNKETSKPIKIKCFNYNTNNNTKNNYKKNFYNSFIENKMKQKEKTNPTIKIKHIKNNKSMKNHKKLTLNQNKKMGFKEHLFSVGNKSIEFCLSYMKPINKRRNLSLGLTDNSNSNTNSIKDLYFRKMKKNNLDNSYFLFDNKSFSLNKNLNGDGESIHKGYTFTNKAKLNTYYQTNSINNISKKKFNMSSLPNLLCNNYMNMKINNYTMSTNEGKTNNNQNSHKNIFEQMKLKRQNKKFKNINFNFGYNNSKIKKIKNYTKIEVKNSQKEKNLNNNKKEKSVMNEKLESIHFGIKSLLDGLYNIYLNANSNTKNINNNINHASCK